MSSENPETRDDSHSELESQMIVRLPEAVARLLREALKHGGGNLKERLSLKLETDMRHGTLYFDNFVLPAKLVDLPCVIEAFKTIDKKSIYKTADICQMLVCTEEEEPEEVETKPQKKKDKDGLVKVEKKFLWPHGVTPPLKNVRKRRFRRILKKKQYSDQPEIEKEVRRLFRMDYEAHHVSWEVIDEEEDKTKAGSSNDVLMQGSKTNENPNASRIAVELFGDDALSDSDADEGDPGQEMEESRMSVEEEVEDECSRLSRLSDSDNDGKEKASSSLVTSFSKDMFETSPRPSSSSSVEPSPVKPGRQEQRIDYERIAKRESLQAELRVLREELADIIKRREIQENELATLENMALRQRLEAVLRRMTEDQYMKERRVQEIESEISNFMDE